MLRREEGGRGKEGGTRQEEEGAGAVGRGGMEGKGGIDASEWESEDKGQGGVHTDRDHQL